MPAQASSAVAPAVTDDKLTAEERANRIKVLQKGLSEASPEAVPADDAPLDEAAQSDQTSAPEAEEVMSEHEKRRRAELQNYRK